MELAEDANATVRGFLDLYDKLLVEAPETPLLEQVVQPVLTARNRNIASNRSFTGTDSLASRASFAGCCARICFTSVELGKLLAIDSPLISFENDVPVNQA
ncbi:MULTISPECIES: hypothetical protein [Neorhizobium]|jgi:hypothetical protein|uniref:hypothetical protein n=1 Tax=Neorhizobium sp. T6_25 TaxID=2093833 RepID=UPI000CF8F9AA|nr:MULTISPECIES: hypothetical protein [Neorhizobium]